MPAGRDQVAGLFMSEPVVLRIEIFSDPICPWCYIGKRRLERALGQTPDVCPQIVWRPFQLNPEMPPEGMERQRYLAQKFGGAEKAREIYASIEAAGEAEQIDFCFEQIARTPSTLASHRLIHYARSQPGGQEAVVEALFASYFCRGEDIGDLDVLTFCAIEAGLDADAARAYLESDAETQRVQAEDHEARRLGIQGVPLFVLERRYAVSGAQSPDVFCRLFQTLQAESATASPRGR